MYAKTASIVQFSQPIKLVFSVNPGEYFTYDILLHI